MDLHGNARLCPFQRELLCRRVRDQEWKVADSAAAAGCSQRTAYKWLARYDNGEPFTDRSSRPHHSPTRTPPATEALIETRRRHRMTGPEIAVKLSMPLSTVTAVLARIGLNHLSRLEPPEPPNRYCRRHPGELIHIDVKKLGRFTKPGHRVTGRGPGHHNRNVGWEAVHFCVDDNPAEHWIHLRTTNPIESTFSTVRLRTRVTRGAGSRSAALAMAYKLLDAAQDRWRRINAPHLVPLVRAGAVFIDGKLQERTTTQTNTETIPEDVAA